MTRRVLPLATASILLSGCAPGDSSSQTAVVRDSAGVLIAENPADASGEEWTLPSPPVLEIGRGEGDGPGSDLFGAIAHAIRLSNGHIAVADRHAQEIRVFDDRRTPRLSLLALRGAGRRGAELRHGNRVGGRNRSLFRIPACAGMTGVRRE